ncbi:MAG: hypothetical protein ACXAC5_02430 [Promethearchaeota archaeon]|jgi:hypothetical protein
MEISESEIKEAVKIVETLLYGGFAKNIKAERGRGHDDRIVPPGILIALLIGEMQKLRKQIETLQLTLDNMNMPGPVLITVPERSSRLTLILISI